MMYLSATDTKSDFQKDHIDNAILIPLRRKVDRFEFQDVPFKISKRLYIITFRKRNKNPTYQPITHKNGRAKEHPSSRKI